MNGGVVTQAGMAVEARSFPAGVAIANSCLAKTWRHSCCVLIPICSPSVRSVSHSPAACVVRSLRFSSRTLFELANNRDVSGCCAPALAVPPHHPPRSLACARVPHS